MSIARAPNVQSATVLQVVFNAIKALGVRAVGIALEEAPFEQAALVYADKAGTNAEEYITQGYFDGEFDGVEFRVSRWDRER